MPMLLALSLMIPAAQDAKPDELKARAKRIEEALKDISAGMSRPGRGPGADDLEDYVFEIVGYRDEQTVRMLAEALEPLRKKATKETTWTQEERDLMRFSFQVLPRVHRESSVKPLSEMMNVLWDYALAVECGRALCNTRSPEANAPLHAARERFGVNSDEWRQIARLFSRVPESAGSAEPKTADDYVRRGIVRADRGDLEGSIADFTRAIELDPTNAAAFIDRGKARYRKGDLDGAIEDATRAIELDPTSAPAFSNRGDARRDKGDLKGAVEDCTRAIELNPKHAQAFNNRGIARANLGDLAGAIADYGRAIELDPKSSNAFNNRGAVRRDNGDLAGAIEDFTRAIELDPKYANAFNSRGVARADKGDIDGAIEDFTHAIELDPKYANAYNSRGISRRNEGDLAGALADFEKALELAPKDAAAATLRDEIKRLRARLEEKRDK